MIEWKRESILGNGNGKMFIVDFNMFCYVIKGNGWVCYSFYLFISRLFKIFKLEWKLFVCLN